MLKSLPGWAATLGARRVPSEEVDRAFGMPLGKLRERAGIESLSYASPEQNELTLGDDALRQALHVADCPPAELDWIIATSETHREYPSLAAQLHKQIGARESCGALDVGGACLGLLNALATAQSFQSIRVSLWSHRELSRSSRPMCTAAPFPLVGLLENLGVYLETAPVRSFCAR